MTPTFIRREQAPPDSLLSGSTVIYQQDGKKWRVTEAEWRVMCAIQQARRNNAIKEKVR